MKFLVSILFSAMLVLTADTGGAAYHPDNACSEAVQWLRPESGSCGEPGNSVNPAAVPDGSIALLLELGAGQAETVNSVSPGGETAGRTVLVLFWGKGCPHCEEEKRFLEELQRDYPRLDVRSYEVWHDPVNAALMRTMLEARGLPPSGVPVTLIHDRVLSGFTSETAVLIRDLAGKCAKSGCVNPLERYKAYNPSAAESDRSDRLLQKQQIINIPLMGELDLRQTPLLLITVAIAGMDSFNPCAFFVLLSLLGIMLHARSRSRMLLVGGIFVFFSGLIYFLFMAAWLNLFLVMGHVAAVTTVAGLVSVAIAAINIKDFFLFKQGISLTIPDSAKPGLFERMRRLLKADSLASIMVGTVVLAIVANSYELLCTAGFPMVYARILTLNNLSTASHYLYLLLYNIIYVIPLAVIVLLFSMTLGRRQLSEWQGRVLKLVSGSMMLGLGGILLINPALLNNVLASFLLLMAALAVALLAAFLARRQKS